MQSDKSQCVYCGTCLIEAESAWRLDPQALSFVAGAKKLPAYFNMQQVTLSLTEELRHSPAFSMQTAGLNQSQLYAVKEACNIAGAMFPIQDISGIH